VPVPRVDAASTTAEGNYLHQLATALWPICRSITGDGVRESLRILQRELPGLDIIEVPSGTPVLDWTVPDEWNITDAYLEGPDGRRVVDFADSNVHVMSYSTPVDVRLPLTELQPHLHSEPALPDAIPYVTSYYTRNWGLCLTQTQRDALPDGEYHAVIDSTLGPGSLTYGELVIPGESTEEVFVTTYICHPSLANNELSGPLVATGLARWLSAQETRRYTYRFVFAPETIGAITYIARNLEHLKTHVVAAYNLTCIGDDGDYSYLASRLGNLPIDRIAKRVIASKPRPVTYSYLDRGSDERHYGMPGVDLPIISLMRTKYGAYPQYHTHLDDLTVVTPTGLQGGLDLVRECVVEFENSTYYEATVLGEPQLGRRGLYHGVHARTVEDVVLLRTHVLAYADGSHSLRDMADLFGLPENEVREIVDELAAHDLLREVPPRKVTL
jgi:aminopeptidase-like protein